MAFSILMAGNDSAPASGLEEPFPTARALLPDCFYALNGAWVDQVFVFAKMLRVIIRASDDHSY